MRARFIDYPLHILGIRVWEHSCQLIARTGDLWTTLGRRWDLPLTVPRSAQDLKRASQDPLRLTAQQYCVECPGSDLAEMLDKTGDFSRAFRARAALAGSPGIER